MDDSVDVAVIGAGQAGLAVSRLLGKAGVHHVILERGAVGESWRSQRWDSFCLNTPNWCNGLPDLEFDEDDRDGFGHRDQLVAYFERYVRRFDLPVEPNTPVSGVSSGPSGMYEVRTSRGTVRARAVVLASGSMSRPRIPALATRLPKGILSISAAEFRNAGVLPAGAVVVVGGGQSGSQIAEDLLAAGRTVYLCASRVGRVPRVYRGRDFVCWWRDMGFLDVAVNEMEDPAARLAAQPQVSGTNGGHTVSLQSLARDGATLLGRLTDVRGGSIVLAGDLLESIAFGDEKCRAFKAAMDEWIDGQGIDAGPASADPGEPPLPDLCGSDERRELDLRDAGVTSIIWCTGYGADWSWVDADVFDPDGLPLHQGGVTASRGLYFIGHPWLSKRSSGILFGVKDDAARIVAHILQDVLHA